MKILAVGNPMNVLTFSKKRRVLDWITISTLFAGSTKISSYSDQDLVSEEVNIAV